MHLHIVELLLAGFYLAGAIVVLIAIFRTHANGKTENPRIQPPLPRIERKRDTNKKNKAA